MNPMEPAKLLKIYIGEDHRYDGRSLHEAIVQKAHTKNLAGVTVYRGVQGYGHKNRLHTSKILRLSQDLPMVIEIIDTQAMIDAFLPELDEMMTEGLVTLEEVQVIRYRG